MRFALAALLGLFFCTELNAAAWTLAEGHGQWIYDFVGYQSNRYVDADGKSSKQATYRKLEDNLYIEYGMTDAWTVGMNPTVQSTSQKVHGSSEDNFNLADTDVFARARVYRDDRNVISIQPLVKVPGFYDKQDLPPLGQGQFDYEMRALYGHNFGTNGRHYIDLEAAYRMRTQKPGDEFRFDGTLGYSLSERWQLLSEVHSVFAMDGAGSSSGLLSNSFDYDLIKVQLAAVYWFTPQWAGRVGGFHDVYSRNTGEGNCLFFGVWYRW